MSFSLRPSPPNQIARFASRLVPAQAGIADYDPVHVPFLDRYFVDPDDTRRRRPCKAQLLAHVDFVEVLDGTPIQMHEPRHIRDGHGTAQSADLHRETQRVPGVV